MERPPSLNEKEEKLRAARLWTETITDKLGHPIDAGIKETIAILHAMGLNTTSSCAGHTGEDGIGFPYVEFYTEAPEGWKEDKNKKELWTSQNLAQRAIIEPLLNEFNEDSAVSHTNNKLALVKMGMYGAFRIEKKKNLRDRLTPNISNDQAREELIEIIKSLQTEMSLFTNFLSTKFNGIN